MLLLFLQHILSANDLIQAIINLLVIAKTRVMVELYN